MRAKTIQVGTLRKWKRDALELMWKCETKDSPSYSEVKLMTKRLTQLIDEVLTYSVHFEVARPVKKED